MKNEIEDMDLPDMLNNRQEDGFGVPEGYFEQLKSRTLLRTVQKQELMDSFKVNEIYFTRLKGQILSKTSAPESSPLRILASHPVFKFAAAALFIVSLNLMMIPALKQNTIPTAASANLSEDEILHYFDQNGTGDLSLTEISLLSKPAENILNPEESEILSHTDEQLIIDAL